MRSLIVPSKVESITYVSIPLPVSQDSFISITLVSKTLTSIFEHALVNNTFELQSATTRRSSRHKRFVIFNGYIIFLREYYFDIGQAIDPINDIEIVSYLLSHI